MCTVHSRRNLAAIHGLALAPSGRGLIAARGDTSGTKWGTTERVSMLIRAPQNRAGVLWSPVSTLLLHLSFENLKSEKPPGITIITCKHLAPYSGNSAATVALWNCQTLSLEVDTKRKSSAARNRISVCPIGGLKKAERWVAVKSP